MKKATIRALKASIKAWENRVDNPSQPIPKGCPLCLRFSNTHKTDEQWWCWPRKDGEECPIKLSTGVENCRHTPEEVYEEIYTGNLWLENREELEDLAKEEVKFLKSLLPEENNE